MKIEVGGGLPYGRAMTRVAGATREKYEQGTSAGGRSRWTRAGVIVAVLTCGISESRLAWADPAQVESLIAEGNELRRQGRNALAVPVFKKAFDLDQTPRTAGQLGLAELAASYPVEAADHLSLALESPDHPWVASNRKSLEKALTKAKSSVAEVMVDGSPSGAIVSINGRPNGALPLAAPIRVPAGRVVVKLSAPDYTSVERVVHVRAGETQRVTASLEKDTSAARVVDVRPDARSVQASSGTAEAVTPSVKTVPAAPVSAGGGESPVQRSTSKDGAPAPGSASSTSGLRVAAWVTAGGAVAGVATGVAYQLAQNATIDQFTQEGCYVEGNSVQATANKSSLTQCQSLHDRSGTQKTVSLVGYIGGAALAITSTILFLLSARSSEAPEDTRQATIQCAPAVGAFFCRGVF